MDVLCHMLRQQTVAKLIFESFTLIIRFLFFKTRDAALLWSRQLTGKIRVTSLALQSRMLPDDAAKSNELNQLHNLFIAKGSFPFQCHSASEAHLNLSSRPKDLGDDF